MEKRQKKNVYMGHLPLKVYKKLFYTGGSEKQKSVKSPNKTGSKKIDPLKGTTNRAFYQELETNFGWGGDARGTVPKPDRRHRIN